MIRPDRTDPAFADPAPVSGLDALSDELTSTHSYEELGLLAPARWAIRVCEELSRWRLYRTDGSAPAAVRVAGSRLDWPLCVPGSRPASNSPEGCTPRRPR